MVNTKIGLSYFAVDTDMFQDRKIKRLKKTFGCAGIAIYFYLLCEVYRDKGCVLVWDEDCAFDVAEYLGIKESLVNEVVKYCGVVGLFDEELLTRGIITSSGIQRRYLEMSKRAKRTSVNIPEEWRVLPEDCAKLPEESGKLPEYCGEIGHSSGDIPEVSDKEKKSKVKKSKVIESESVHAHALAHEDNPNFELFKKFENWCEEYTPSVLGFREPLTFDQFMWLHDTYGAKKIKECAQQMHNKDASSKCRSAIYTWKEWIVKLR